MKDFLPKLFFSLIAISLTTLAIELIPISRQAASWIRCLNKTSETLRKVKAVQLMDDQGIEVLSVMICNGAVFEPKFKTNIR